MRQQHRVVIRQRRTWLAIAIPALIVAVAVGIATTLFLYVRGVGVGGGLAAMTELERLRAERAPVDEELKQLRRELAAIRDQGVSQTRSCEIEAEVCRALKQSLTTVEKESADLREQLAFYRNIVSPEHQRAGIRVLELAILPGETATSWRYDLVLVQGVGQSRTAEGRFEFSVEGSQGGKPKRLEAAALKVEKPRPQAYSFKYFQEFGGEIRLPEGFQPSQLSVTLIPQGDTAGSGRVAETYEWSRLLAAGRSE